MISLGRVQIVHGTPPAQPGKCVMCGTTEGSFIDIGFEIEFYGVVYWCFNNCFREIANALEYQSPQQVKTLKHHYDLLVVHNKDLYQENAELRDALDSLINASKFAAARPGVLSDSESLVKVDSRDESKSEGSEQRSTKQIDESGSTGVQHDDSLTELLDSFDI